MFGTKKADAMTDITAAQQEAEAFRAKLVLPAKSNFLALAERNLAKLRADRRALESRRTAIVHASMGRTDGARLPDEFEDLGAQIANLDQEIIKARAERDRRRGDFQDRTVKDISASVADWRAAVLHRLNELESLLRAGVDLHGEAALAGIELGRHVDAAPSLLGLLRAQRAALR